MNGSSNGAQEQALPTEIAQDSWVPPAGRTFPSHPVHCAFSEPLLSSLRPS